jgi:hypothetical protein
MGTTNKEYLLTSFTGDGSQAHCHKGILYPVDAYFKIVWKFWLMLHRGSLAVEMKSIDQSILLVQEPRLMPHQPFLSLNV